LIYTAHPQYILEREDERRHAIARKRVDARRSRSPATVFKLSLAPSASPTKRSRGPELSDGKRSLAEAGAAIRQVILRGEWPKETAEAIRLAYGELNRRTGQINMDVDSLTKLVHYTRRELICLNEPTRRRQT
jgi:hypothetical protein